jgi:hypothetical protein
MTPNVAGEVMEQLKWNRGASGVFRQTCKGWRYAHDQSVIRLTVLCASLPWSCVLKTRFPALTGIGLRGTLRPAPNPWVVADI